MPAISPAIQTGGAFFMQFRECLFPENERSLPHFQDQSTISFAKKEYSRACAGWRERCFREKQFQFATVRCHHLTYKKDMYQ